MASVPDLADGEMTVVTGTLSMLVHRITKQGRPWASAVITVDGTAFDLMVYPNAWSQFGAALTDGATVTIPVRADRRSGELTLTMLEEPQPGSRPDMNLPAQIDALLAERGITQ